MGTRLAFLPILCIFTLESIYMKLTKTTLFIALSVTVLAGACRKSDEHTYMCRCTGNSLGPVETYRITSTSDADAKEQCVGFAQAPGADSTVCALD
jgi:hypothetical protein